MENSTNTSLKFLKALPLYKTVQPYKLHDCVDMDVDCPETNCEFETIVDIPIQDMRGRVESFSLDQEGFEILRCPSQYAIAAEHFESPSAADEIALAYVKETMDIIKQHMNAVEIIAIDWRVSIKAIVRIPNAQMCQSLEGTIILVLKINMQIYRKFAIKPFLWQSQCIVVWPLDS